MHSITKLLKPATLESTLSAIYIPQKAKSTFINPKTEQKTNRQATTPCGWTHLESHLRTLCPIDNPQEMCDN